MSVSGARRTAFNALLRVEKDGAYPNQLLAKALPQLPDEREKRLASALVYGVLENRELLDYVIASLVSRPIKKLERAVVILLRLGIYQLLFMEKIPDSAAVNETVNLAKAVNAARVSGMINAVLRNFIRQEKKIPLPDEKKDYLLFLSVKYSCPKWILKLWIDAYGREMCENIAQGLSGRPPLYLRANTTRISARELAAMLEENGVKAKALPLYGALEVEQMGDIEQSKAYQDGLFHVQDLSSQLCCMLTGASAGNSVIDVCAAPGGKSFTLSETVGENGTVESFDIFNHKVELIKNGANRLGLSNISVALRDAAQPQHSPECADIVLCDAPCSGLGIIRRKPDIKGKSEADIAALPELQLQILRQSAKLVKCGGILMYSTCTLNPAENEQVVEQFLADNAQFEPCALEIPQEYPFKRLRGEPAHMLTLFPSRKGSDGFFMARMRRKDN